MEPDPSIDRVLVVGAHPDDIDFGCAGTVAAWTAAGVHVAYCLVTDGDAGGFDAAVPRSEIGGIRRAEQTAAAAAVGVTDVTFLGYPDGRVEVTLDLRRDLARVIRRVRPGRVVTQSPRRTMVRVFADHPDHLATGEATLCAVYPDARNPFAFPELMAEGLDAHVVDEVWFPQIDGSGHAVDITDTFDLKMAALRSHVSQVAGERDPEPFLRQLLAERAQRAGLAPGRLAEVFSVFDTSERR
jgi:LmbE family N-acetylglucosaminyl deacetylase